MYQKNRANRKYIQQPLTPLHRYGNTKESDIVTTILRYLRTVPGCFAWKTHGGMYGTAGIPDIIACVEGRFFAFEVKTATGKATPLQKATLQKILASGGTAAVVRSVDEVRAIIQSMAALRNDQ
jgi:Holliday junction resolvase